MSEKPSLKTLISDFGVLKRLVAENMRVFLPRYILAILCMALVAAATGFSAWIMRDLINKVFIDRDARVMFLICASVALIYIVKGVASYGQEVILARIGNAIVASTQRKIFNALLAQDVPFFQNSPSSDLVTRITYNAQAASSALNLIATSLGRDLLTVAGLLFVMLSQDVALTGIALIGLPVLFGVITRLLRRVRTLFGSEVRSVAATVATIQETIHGIRVIKAFRLEDAMRQRMAGSVGAVERLSNSMVGVQAITVPLIDTLGGIAVSSVIFYGGWRVINEGATPGEFFSFITALLMMTEPARRLARLHLSLAASAVGVRMLYELVDLPPSTMDREDAQPLSIKKGDIALSSVSFGYDPESPVLHAVDLEAKGGEITALVGLSGSGKSSIFNLIMRFWSPQTGRVVIDGQSLSDTSAASLYDHISLVGQDVFLFEGTISENIMRGRSGASEHDMIEAARKAAAHEFILSLPEGYATIVGEFGSKLSGGQRQRIAIARAFLKDAPILLLDEPTSALDAESDAAIQEALTRLMNGRTTLIIAHRLATVASANSIYVLDQGRVVEHGTHKELLAKAGVYSRLYDLQFAGTD
ncbi:MAG: ABC transporter ATP-binding protein [Beijerinckiaceae bacterium]|nr:ABC transporter ATP-binding protein [Beijerinckiaceae bacterium]